MVKITSLLTLALVVGPVVHGATATAADPPELRAVVAHPGDEAAEFRYAQALYRAGEFESFFGLTQWVRLRLWSKLSAVQKDRWLALELTALARRCRWAEIDRLAQTEGRGLALSEEALSIIRLKQDYRGFAKDRSHFEDRASASSRSPWASSPDEYRRFDSPIHLKVRVENLCRT